MTAEISSTLTKYIAEKILKQPSRNLVVHEPIISSGLIDSFSLVDLALFVEDSFGVRLDDSELNATTFDSIAQLTKLIQSRQVK